MKFASERGDILGASMHKNSVGILIMLTVVGLLIVLLLSTSISGMAARTGAYPELAGRLQLQTATPDESDLTQSGSTDGIMWLGVVIVAIVLLPILIRKETWR